MHDESTPLISPARLEAFSDGVIAIAITLLILEIRVPELEPGHSLWEGLRDILPIGAAFLISFLTIGIMWINHHNLFRLIRHVDQNLLILNTLLLLMITFVNFPTALLGEYLLTDQFQAATIVYTGSFAVTAILFNLLWRYASYRGRLLGDNPNAEVIRAINTAYNTGLAAYIAVFLIAFISAPLAVLGTFALVVFFALPRSSGQHKPKG
ncbi:MAG: TMEM175 family protein [Anaerolineae bacterium]